MFSVVIPLYNKELSIENTLQSVLNQTFQEFEIVIVNDGSTDNSVEVVKQFKDERIRIINQENQGVSTARNKGIKEAKYEWIAFLDGDDLWMENHLEEIVKMMKHYPNEKVYVTSFEYSDKREIYRHPRESSIFKIEDYFKEAIKEPLIWTSIVIVQKDILIQVGLFESHLILGEDKDLWSRLGREFNIIKSRCITAIYRIEAENRSNKKTNIKQTFEGVLDLYNVKSEQEYAYYKHHIFAKLKALIVRKDLKSLMYLLKKHNIKLLTIKMGV